MQGRGRPPRECLLTGCVLYSLLAITPNSSSVTDTQEWTHRQHPGTASKDGSQHQAEKRNTHRLTHKKRKDCPLFKILHLLFICELSRRSFFCFVLVKPVFFFLCSFFWEGLVVDETDGLYKQLFLWQPCRSHWLQPVIFSDLTWKELYMHLKTCRPAAPLL